MENEENKSQINEDSQQDIAEASNEVVNDKMEISEENLKKQAAKKSAKSIADIS